MTGKDRDAPNWSDLCSGECSSLLAVCREWLFTVVHHRNDHHVCRQNLPISGAQAATQAIDAARSVLPDGSGGIYFTSEEVVEYSTSLRMARSR